jgi:hypothetical protein
MAKTMGMVVVAAFAAAAGAIPKPDAMTLTGRRTRSAARAGNWSVGADLTVHIRTIGRVAHQPTNFDNLATGIGCGNPIARRERRKLDTSAGEEHVASDEQGLRPVAHEVGEGGLDFADGAGVEELNLKAEGTGSFRHIS